MSIKEILERISKYVITPDVEDDFNNLKDYITNLQKELEMLVKDDERSQKTIIEHAQRIDKAIEFINDNSHSNIKMNFMNKSEKIECKFNNNTDPRDLLDILKGSE